MLYNKGNRAVWSDATKTELNGHHIKFCVTKAKRNT